MTRHRAIMDVFLSKDVTYIIQNSYRTRGRNVERSTVLNSINARSANMVQASVQRNSISNVGSGFLYPTLTLSLQSVKRMARECDERGHNASRKQNKNQVISEKPFDMVNVRSLTGTYIKVEDLEGQHKPLFKEMA